MGLQGLAAFKQQQEEKSYTKAESPYFKLEKGQTVKIRPLVELDENGKNFDKDKGTANFVKEYTNPVKFWKKIVDTYPEEGKCVGFEMTKRFGWFAQKPDPEKGQHSDKTKKWNPTQRFYLPVLVDRLDGSEPTVEVLQNTYGEKSPSQALVDFYEAKNTLTDRWWTYSRNGKEGEKQEMKDTVYKFIPDDPSKLDTSKYEVPDIDDDPYVFHVPYDQQWDFLLIDETYPEIRSGATQAPSSSATNNSTPPDEDWG